MQQHTTVYPTSNPVTDYFVGFDGPRTSAAYATSGLPTDDRIACALPAAYPTDLAEANQVTTKESEADRKAAAEPVWAKRRAVRAASYASAVKDAQNLGLHFGAGYYNSARHGCTGRKAVYVYEAPSPRLAYAITPEGNGYVLTTVEGTRLTAARSTGNIDARATLVSFAVRHYVAGKVKVTQ